MSEESDVEMKTVMPLKSKKAPKSPTAETLKEPKKLTTKEMIHEALVELKSRKGTSLFAIKKYLELKYNIDVEKIKHIIKKQLITSVEDGTIIQTKGNGASGSFKLVVSKDKPKKKKKTDKKTEKKNTEKKEVEKSKKEKPKLKNAESKTKGERQTKMESEKTAETKKKTIKPKKKIEKSVKTPAKKRAAMMKRKSIGSIIKPPKMKPAAKTVPK